MATPDQVISFRLLKESADILDNAYGSANKAANRITDALPFLRERTFDELRGQFHIEEILYLISMVKLIDFDPRFMANKAAMITEVKDAGIHRGLAETWQVNVQQLIIRLDQLATVQFYFLLDYCKNFWEAGFNPEDINEYAKYLTK